MKNTLEETGTQWCYRSHRVFLIAAQRLSRIPAQFIFFSLESDLDKCIKLVVKIIGVRKILRNIPWKNLQTHHISLLFVWKIQYISCYWSIIMKFYGERNLIISQTIRNLSKMGLSYINANSANFSQKNLPSKQKMTHPPQACMFPNLCTWPSLPLSHC